MLPSPKPSPSHSESPMLRHTKPTENRKATPAPMSGLSPIPGTPQRRDGGRGQGGGYHVADDRDADPAASDAGAGHAPAAGPGRRRGRGGGRGFAERAAAAAAAEEAAAAPAAGHDGVGGEERDRSSAGLTISFFPPSFFSFLFPSRNGGVCCRAGQLSRDTWRLTSRRSGWVARL